MKLYDVNRAGEQDLYAVVSVREAAQLVYRSPRTIRHHIDAGNLAARRLGHDYIISLASLRAYYGDVKRPRSA